MRDTGHNWLSSPCACARRAAARRQLLSMGGLRRRSDVRRRLSKLHMSPSRPRAGVHDRFLMQLGRAIGHIPELLVQSTATPATAPTTRMWSVRNSSRTRMHPDRMQTITTNSRMQKKRVTDRSSQLASAKGGMVTDIADGSDNFETYRPCTY